MGDQQAPILMLVKTLAVLLFVMVVTNANNSRPDEGAVTTEYSEALFQDIEPETSLVQVHHKEKQTKALKKEKEAKAHKEKKAKAHKEKKAKASLKKIAKAAKAYQEKKAKVHWYKEKKAKAYQEKMSKAQKKEKERKGNKEKIWKWESGWSKWRR